MQSVLTFVFILLAGLWSFTKPASANSCYQAFSPNSLEVQLSDSSSIMMPAISTSQLQAIYQQLHHLTCSFNDDQVPVIWGDLGGVYGPCGSKANIIRHYLTTGKNNLPEYSFSETDTVTANMKSAAPKVATSLLIGVYNLQGINFDYELIEPDGHDYVPTGIKGKVEWGSHKAVVVNHEGRLTVIDPLLSGPLPVHAWIHTFIKQQTKVPFLTTDEGKALSTALYSPFMRDQLNGPTIGYTLSSDFSLHTANIFDLGKRPRRQLGQAYSLRGTDLDQQQLFDLVRRVRIRVTRRR